MFAGMNDHPFLTGSSLADNWPMTRVMAGLSAVPVGHALDLAALFPVGDDAWPDVVRVETRRHLGGCLTAVETALRLKLERMPDMAAALAQTADPLCWTTLCLRPALLCPSLLAHMRLRATVGILLRQYGMATDDDDAGDEDKDRDGLFDAGASGADAEAMDGLATALTLAEGRWATPGGENQPMRPDLPAEHFAELVWIAAACVALAAGRGDAANETMVIDLVGRAGSALLAAHDEAAGPIALADRLVRAMGAGADDPGLPGTALRQRRFLLFAALAARKARIDTLRVIDVLLLSPIRDVASFCRPLGVADADYRHLLLALQPVRPPLTDAAMVAAADYYQALNPERAEAQAAMLRAPAGLRAKLDHLRGVMPE
ncbi:MAG: hypothetical protein AB7E60_14540 [Sphingobium sp.]